ncbi:TPA: TnP I resolvase, partial [Bacillus cereus]
MDVAKQFSSYLKQENKTENTVQGYTSGIRQYIKWFEGSYDRKLTKLYRQNILEYISYLKNVKMLNAKSINHKISSLAKFNEFLIQKGSQQDQVILKTDMIKVQTVYASPTQIVELDVKKFLQSVLEDNNKRNYAIATLLAYTGVRISEALSIKMNDFNLQTGECI